MQFVQRGLPGLRVKLRRCMSRRVVRAQTCVECKYAALRFVSKPQHAAGLEGVGQGGVERE